MRDVGRRAGSRVLLTWFVLFVALAGPLVDSTTSFAASPDAPIKVKLKRKRPPAVPQSAFAIRYGPREELMRQIAAEFSRGECPEIRSATSKRTRKLLQEISTDFMQDLLRTLMETKGVRTVVLHEVEAYEVRVRMPASERGRGRTRGRSRYYKATVYLGTPQAQQSDGALHLSFSFNPNAKTPFQCE